MQISICCCVSYIIKLIYNFLIISCISKTIHLRVLYIKTSQQEFPYFFLDQDSPLNKNFLLKRYFPLFVSNDSVHSVHKCYSVICRYSEHSVFNIVNITTLDQHLLTTEIKNILSAASITMKLFLT